MAEYLPIIGLEIHAELKTKTKMFCSCPNGYYLAERPNENVCPICLGHPGTLPVINRQGLDWTILVGLALKSKISQTTKFDRKNYFYPDLPKGYQISQYDQPLCYQGELKIAEKTVKVVRIHLEEDTGKLIHHPEGVKIDYSRAGTPLIELVTAPEINSSREAKEFCRLYQEILRYLEVSDADMEKGQMRCEANISLQEAGRFIVENNELKPLLDYQLNPKVELKNINSFRAVERAINYEIKRQTKALKTGETLIQETRGWDEAKQATFNQRIKETAADYRYFPEPDLPPLEISSKKISELEATLPELPPEKFERFVSQYLFNPEDAEIIVSNKKLASYTEETISELRSWLNSLPEIKGDSEKIWSREGKKLTKLLSNWLINRLFRYLKEEKISVSELKITPENFAEFLSLIYQRKLNNLTAQKVLKEMVANGQDPSEIIKEKDLGQVNGQKELLKIVDETIGENPKASQDYRQGKENSLKFLVGRVMAATKGKADPQLTAELLKKQLNKQ